MPDNKEDLRPEQADRSLLKWTIATAAGFMTAYLTSEFVAQHLGQLRPELHQSIIGAVSGSIIGVCQGRYFYKYGPPIWKAWVASSVVGWMMGTLLQLWALGWTAMPIIEHFGRGLGTTLLGQAVMGASSGFPIVAAQAFVLARFMTNREWKSWLILAWASFILAGISYAVFVRVSQAMVPGLPWSSANGVLLALGWALKGSVVGFMTGRGLFKRLK
jgi:hypothetical protein